MTPRSGKKKKKKIRFPLTGVIAVIIPLLIMISFRQNPKTKTRWYMAKNSEFWHDNKHDICPIKRVPLQVWEDEKLWRSSEPVLVTGVTNEWTAIENWSPVELQRRYGNLTFRMGSSLSIGQAGPDQSRLEETTLSDFVTTHLRRGMYIFDRSSGIPPQMMEDIQPLPKPTGVVSGWNTHTAFSIGYDQEGLTWHRHGSAWNTVVYGAKRWLMYPFGGREELLSMSRGADGRQRTSADWIRHLYVGHRKQLMRDKGYDCIQRPGELMYVPHGWMHMVVNIGETLSVVKERTGD